MYKKFIINLILLFIPFSIFILFVNIRVGSGFILKKLNIETAKKIVEGKNVGVINIPTQWGGLQEAIVNEGLKLKNSFRKDIIVFGTSRSSEINSKIFPQKSFFNCVVPGGNILDYIALYGLYKKNNILPKYLIISLDPWTFHSRKQVMLNKKIQLITDLSVPLKVNNDLRNNYNVGMKYMGINNNYSYSNNDINLTIDNIIEYFNLNLFQHNLPYLFEKAIIISDNTINKFYFIIRSDGGYSLQQQSDIDSNYVKSKSFSLINIQKSNFFIPSDTNSIYFAYFKKLLITLKKDGVIPIVYISPVNPIVFDNMSKSSKVEIEDKIDIFCRNYKICRIGSFNPHKYGYNTVSNLFIDEYHPVKLVVDNVFNYHIKELQNLGIKINIPVVR